MAKKWLNYHHLYYFKVIATEGGIAKAAQKLRLGQPTLSTQLKQFEDILGVSLFDRSKRNLVLTDAGHTVLGYANDIFRIGDELLDTISDHHDAHKFQVQVGVCDSVPKQISYKIFDFVAAKQESYLTLTQGKFDELLRELRAHQLDLVISNISPSVADAKGFYCKHVAKMPIIVCGGKKFAHLKKNFPLSMHGQPVILPGGSTKLRMDVEHFLKANEIDIDPIAEIQDTAVQKIIAIHEHGLVFLNAPVADELLEQKDLYALGTLPHVYEELWVIAAERKLQNPIAQSVLKEFKL